MHTGERLQVAEQVAASVALTALRVLTSDDAASTSSWSTFDQLVVAMQPVDVSLFCDSSESTTSSSITTSSATSSSDSLSCDSSESTTSSSDWIPAINTPANLLLTRWFLSSDDESESDSDDDAGAVASRWFLADAVARVQRPRRMALRRAPLALPLRVAMLPDDENTRGRFRFRPPQLAEKVNALRVPARLTLPNGSSVCGETAFLLVLRRLANITKLAESRSEFNYDESVLSPQIADHASLPALRRALRVIT